MAIPINIRAVNMELTDAIENYIEEHLAKLDKVVPDEDTSAHADVEVGKVVADQRSGEIYRAEINLHIAGQYHYVRTERDDLYAAIDELQEEIVREVKRARGRQKDLIRRGARKLKNLLRRS